MPKHNVKNGTPVGSEHLCERCSWGQCMTGYRESDRMVICTNTNPNIVVPFHMLECTSFNDKHRPSWGQMQKLAINLQPVRLSAKTAGFRVAANAPAPEPDADEEVAQANKAVPLR